MIVEKKKGTIDFPANESTEKYLKNQWDEIIKRGINARFLLK